MLRYFAGVVSALLLVAAGIFIWKSQAEADPMVPPAPEPVVAVTPLKPGPVPRPPEASPKSKEERRFARADKDDDGRITRAEMMQPRLKAFARLDKNGDSRLSFEEWAVTTGERFARADADRNGALTPREFETTKPKAKAAARRCAC